MESDKFEQSFRSTKRWFLELQQLDLHIIMDLHIQVYYCCTTGEYRVQAQVPLLAQCVCGVHTHITHATNLFFTRVHVKDII